MIFVWVSKHPETLGGSSAVLSVRETEEAEGEYGGTPLEEESWQ